MIRKRKKIANRPETLKEVTTREDEAIKVGKAYDFLFEGENNDYDEEYNDYI
ncbi:hypothetical protein [Halalkalibacterium halodurans]|uniref:hypothetical protein n=1 Tax=Halalkalibacterium halodurans TaxID=86665 RepID=UPI00141A4727|nr:hypothetical protein [Halalkalibacterium halodurans]